jgi:putative endonuclease
MKPAPKTKRSTAGTRTSAAWMLYLIECANGALYAGITNDLVRRYALHAAGRGARYTRANPPVRLVAYRRYPDKSAALRAEYAVRQLAARDKPAFVRGKRAGRVPAAIARLMGEAGSRGGEASSGGVVARRGAPTGTVARAAERTGAKDTGRA